MVNTLHQRVSAASTASGDTGDLSAGQSGAVDLDIEVTAVTATDSAVFTLQKKGEDGTYTTIWTSAAVTGAVSVIKNNIPVRGGVCQSLPTILKLVRTITNVSGSPSITYSASIVGHQ